MKKVLSIAGGGTLGTYVTQELKSKSVKVDVICLDDYENEEYVTYYKEDATYDFLQAFLQDKEYDAIINFCHYVNIKEYEEIYRLLSRHTKQIMFLSSYRVYADKQHPITEDAPTWLDTDVDEIFIKTENYAMPKLKCESFLKGCPNKNWTIVRPVISFSDKRFDLYTYSGMQVFMSIENNQKLILPIDAKNITAGLDWSGNTGKIMANLLFKENTLGETYTISSEQNITWGELAEIYHRVMGVEYDWVSMEDFVRYGFELFESGWGWELKYDRIFDRTINAQKVLKAANMNKPDFTSIEDALKLEFEKFKSR